MQEQSDTCFQCDLPVECGDKYPVNMEGEKKYTCCPGCQAVAKVIIDNGLGDFYRYRTEHNKFATRKLLEQIDDLKLYDNAAIQKNFVYSDKQNIKQVSLLLEGIVCAACVWLSEHHIQQLPGVIRFQVNYSTHRANLEWDNQQIQLSQILSAIRDIGYIAYPVDQNRQEAVFKRERQQAIRRIAVAGLGAMQVMMLAVALYSGRYDGMDAGIESFLRWVSLLITAPVLLYSSRPFFVAAMRDIRAGGLGMDVPVALAIAAAFTASAWATITHSGEVYFDSVTMFTFFLLTGRFLEMLARHRAGRAAEDMVKLVPAMATRLDNDTQQTVAVSELEIGDLIVVKPGESIPADSILLSERASVDESLLTGESMPVNYTKGDQVIAGSVNIDTVLKLKVLALGTDTVLASIQRILERAQTEKPRLALLADKVAGYFVLALLIVAAVVGSYWIYRDSGHAFWVVISVLVVTCPCALSLATPTALTAAMGRLSRLGMLTTRGHALETLAKVTHVIFDKTGTLTQGHLDVIRISTFADLSEQQCLQIAASIEQFSEHPIGKSICRQYSTQPLLTADNVLVDPGMGIQASIADTMYFIGRSDFVTRHAAVDTQCNITSASVYLARPGKLLAAFEFADLIRASANSAIQSLQAAGIESMILSGDSHDRVMQVAQQLGIKSYHAELDPAAKLEIVSQLQRDGAIVAMVGDGINDAPVLAKAQVSIAMGQGTQIAQASADMILLSSDLNHIAAAIHGSKRTASIIKQNFTWAVMYNLIALPLAATGLVAPWMAAIGMSMSSLIVVLNALRLTSMQSASKASEAV